MLFFSFCLDPCADIKCAFGATCVVQNSNQTGRNGKCVCSQQCSTNISNVCGTDEKTYDNVCILRKGACMQQKNISVAYNGTCGKYCMSFSFVYG